MTNERLHNIRAAIGLAREPGACVYHRHGAPVCVVGQLLALEGHDVTRIPEKDQALNCTGFDSVQRGMLERSGYSTAEILFLASRIQNPWDQKDETLTEAGRRQTMLDALGQAP